jgi:hypothetical protein
MNWSINIPNNKNHNGQGLTNKTIIHTKELETKYDDIILSYESDDKVINECTIFKLPNTIIYHYIYHSHNVTFPNLIDLMYIKVLHQKYLLLIYLHAKNPGELHNAIMHILDIETGRLLSEKKINFQAEFSKINTYAVINNNNTYTFIYYAETNMDLCMELFDQEFASIKKFYINSTSFNDSINNIPISNNYIMIAHNSISVYDFVNDSIIFEDNSNSNFRFIKWKDNYLIYNINGTIKVQEIININECSCCLGNNDKKTALVPCGHTQLCSVCATNEKMKYCPICKKDIQMVLNLH